MQCHLILRRIKKTLIFFFFFLNLWLLNNNRKMLLFSLSLDDTIAYTIIPVIVDPYLHIAGCDRWLWMNEFTRGMSTTFYLWLFVCGLLTKSLTQKEIRDIIAFTQLQLTFMGTDNRTIQTSTWHTAWKIMLTLTFCLLN